MSIDREAEVRRLNLADCHIADAERHITDQWLILEQQRAAGRDTQDAERLLETMEETLSTFQEHRRMIVEMIDRIDAGLA
ncbi:hypothetical protein [Methylobacterium tarhaniae]|uniref:hypothetical protein n=1 Tax=Methylobacterium tarhaniae TaxID=1187852 RepID=UPI003CFF2598